QGSGTAGHHPVHRILVQSATASLGTGLPTSTRSSRRTRKSSHRRLTIPDLMPLSGKREAPQALADGGSAGAFGGSRPGPREFGLVFGCVGGCESWACVAGARGGA